jgi:RNA polymerase sigma-70 factor (ECF subfamily)
VTPASTDAQDDARARLTAALVRAGEGDRSALRTVYDATHAKLFGIVLRICRERQAAEDVLQDVYLTIWRRAGAFDPGRASPITWMATIARNRAIDRVRSSAIRRTEPEDAALEVADESPLAPELIARAQTATRLHTCLDTLEERQQTVIRTAFFDGLTYAELADRLTVPLGTVKSWIRRGMMKLKECLGDVR